MPESDSLTAAIKSEVDRLYPREPDKMCEFWDLSGFCKSDATNVTAIITLHKSAVLLSNVQYARNDNVPSYVEKLDTIIILPVVDKSLNNLFREIEFKVDQIKTLIASSSATKAYMD